MKKRVLVTLNPDLVESAKKLMKSRQFDNFSNFIEVLIREEWERRTTSELLNLRQKLDWQYQHNIQPDPADLRREKELDGTDQQQLAAEKHGATTHPKDFPANQHSQAHVMSDQTKAPKAAAPDAKTAEAIADTLNNAASAGKRRKSQ